MSDNTTEVTGTDEEPTLTDEQWAQYFDIWLNGFKTGIESTYVNAGGMDYATARQNALIVAGMAQQDQNMLDSLRKHMAYGLAGKHLPPEDLRIRL